MQANAICTRRNRELASAAPQGVGLRQVLATASRRAAIQRMALRELERLAPPANLVADWRTVVSDSARTLKATETLAKLAGSSGTAGFRRETALVDQPQLGLLIAGVRVGAKACSVVAQPSVRGL